MPKTRFSRRVRGRNPISTLGGLPPYRRNAWKTFQNVIRALLGMPAWPSYPDSCFPNKKCDTRELLDAIESFTCPSLAERRGYEIVVDMDLVRSMQKVQRAREEFDRRDEDSCRELQTTLVAAISALQNDFNEYFPDRDPDIF
jgi:hypothetical protein